MTPDPFVPKLWVRIKNTGAFPIVLTSAYFVRHKKSTIALDPRTRVDRGSNRSRCHFYDDTKTEHRENEILLRGRTETLVYVGLDPDLDPNQVDKSLELRLIGRLYFHISWWTDNVPKFRLF